MCGIFAYTGMRTAEPILIEGLRMLEYRGYDSAGIYVPGYGAVKSVGAIDNLVKKITDLPVRGRQTGTVPGTSGIAHTRWATHGAPTEENAHPHSDMSGAIWLVHNGIIENYRDLKEGLRVQGVTFSTETDTEVLVKLIGTFNEGDLTEAVRKALSVVQGTYGIAVMSAHDPNTIIVARMGSPIVLGLSAHGNLVSSDPSALLTHTKDVVYLDDGDIAVVTGRSYEVITSDGQKKEKRPEKAEGDVESIRKDGFEHYLLKEIMEIPETIENTMRGRLIPERGRAKLGGLENVLSELAALERLIIVGCGSASYAGTVGKYIIEEYARLSVDVELGSEYRYRTVLPKGKSALLAISQSGETADTLASIKKGKELGLLTLGIVNTIGSTIARETDAGVYNHAGPEISVASTKVFISQIVALILMTLLVGRERSMRKEEGKEIVKALQELPAVARKVLHGHEAVRSIAVKYADYRDIMCIGRKFHAPISFEGALKLKEVTYIHADAYAAGELKHGPIAMLDEEFPVIAFVPRDDVYDKMLSNIEEIKARKAPVLAIASEGDMQIGNIVDDVIYVPEVHPIVQPIISTIPMYLLAYYIGVSKGLNVDRPRNLAKSVTVE